MARPPLDRLDLDLLRARHGESRVELVVRPCGCGVARYVEVAVDLPIVDVVASCSTKDDHEESSVVDREEHAVTSDADLESLHTL